MKEEINKALAVLRAGGLILYPTDTIWGIGCDATNEEAVAKIFKLKGRSESKSLIILLENANKLPSYVYGVPDVAYDLVEYAEKPLTIVYSGAKNLAANVVAEDGSVGIRIVKHTFCKQLIQQFRKPIVSTSANLSGEPAPVLFEDIDQQIIKGVDYVAPKTFNEATSQLPSTIIKLEADGRFKFIRK